MCIQAFVHLFGVDDDAHEAADALAQTHHRKSMPDMIKVFVVKYTLSTPQYAFASWQFAAPHVLQQAVECLFVEFGGCLSLRSALYYPRKIFGGSTLKRCFLGLPCTVLYCSN
jgi:hypothetical protein